MHHLVTICILAGHIGTVISYLFIHLFSVQIRNQHLQKPKIIKYQIDPKSSGVFFLYCLL